MEIRWNLDAAVGGMQVGQGFFLPCMDCERARRVLHLIAREFNYRIMVQVSFEGYLRGVRVRRIA
jgi:hypothetical protein